MKNKFSTQLGFTLVELLVVISLMSILMLTSIVTFSSFTRTQSFQTSVSDVVSLLNKAKSRSLNQVKPVDCATDSLKGYQVSFTLSDSSYKLEVACGDTTHLLETKKLSPQITFADTSSPSVFFNVATGVVDVPKEVVITGFDKNKTINIDGVGNISVR
jgi:prepilin-type N-terminal cleavage/methylation domain-containing protein